MPLLSAVGSVEGLGAVAGSVPSAVGPEVAVCSPRERCRSGVVFSALSSLSRPPVSNTPAFCVLFSEARRFGKEKKTGVLERQPGSLGDP